MGVADKFEKFIIDLRTKNHSKVKERYEEITRLINFDFRKINSSTKYSRYVGSYGRGTSISASDIDFMIELPATEYHKYNAYTSNGQSSLLQAVKQSIKETNELTTNIRGDGQVVVVNYWDGMHFEVVPVFLNTSDTYTYPDANGGGLWRTMDPIAEIDALNSLNNKYNNKIKHLVRMIKCWKNYNSVPIKGILIETLAINFMSQWNHNDKSYLYYDYMIRDFMKYLSELSTSQEKWRIHGSQRYAFKTGSFQRKADDAYKIACTAIKYDNTNEYMATLYWRDIFGNAFRGS